MSGSSGKCMEDACLCCYDGCDCDKIMCCYLGAGDILCFRNSCCFAINAKPRGCGCTGDELRGEICKIGLFCCDLGIIYPTKLCGCASQCLCCYQVASFPCSKEYVPKPVCSYCFLQCCPRCACCAAPPDCPALDKIQKGDLTVVLVSPPAQQAPMERGGTKTHPSIQAKSATVKTTGNKVVQNGKRPHSMPSPSTGTASNQAAQIPSMPSCPPQHITMDRVGSRPYSMPQPTPQAFAPNRLNNSIGSHGRTRLDSMPTPPAACKASVGRHHAPRHSNPRAYSAPQANPYVHNSRSYPNPQNEICSGAPSSSVTTTRVRPDGTKEVTTETINPDGSLTTTRQVFFNPSATSAA